MILPPDKSLNYRIPNLEGHYVRTGIIGDGSCFFHSYLKAFNFKYKTMTTSARKDVVMALRNELASAVDLNSFMKISKGEYRKMLFFGALRQLIRQNATFLSEKQMIDALESATSYKTNFYEKFIEEAFKCEELASAPNSKKQRFVDDMKQLFVKANEMSLNHLKEQLLTAEIGATEIEYISRHLKCNFLFLYETNDGIEVYPFSTIIDVEWPYCVLLWVDGSHYEIIGIKEGNIGVINRIFYKDDEIVKLFASQNDLKESNIKE